MKETAQEPEALIFPRLRPGGPDNKLGYYFTKWFSAYRREIGVYENRLGAPTSRSQIGDGKRCSSRLRGSTTLTCCSFPSSFSSAPVLGTGSDRNVGTRRDAADWNAKQNRTDLVRPEAEAILRERDVSFDPATPEFHRFARGMLERLYRVLKVEENRHLGNYSDPVALPLSTAPAELPTDPTSQQPVSMAFDRFLNMQSREVWNDKTSRALLRSL